MSIGVCIYIWVLDLIPFIHLSVSIPIPCGFYYCSSVAELETRENDTSRISFIVQNSFSYLGFLFFHKKLNIVLSSSVKNCVGF